MSRLSDISSSPVLREFAQGAAQSAIMPVADFLAPTIEVPTSVGRYKRYTEKDRFRIPNTLRTIGGRATELRFEVTDEIPERHGALMEKLESIERRLFVDNGSPSVQTRLARHDMVIRAILWAVTALGGAAAAALARAFGGSA